ncbi:MAG TPA: hypothetical protein VKA84_16380 [Gemmatimonadaceae bacterium]|nr:hypothetical protein [Gemmatimonadaceae bacterium]
MSFLKHDANIVKQAWVTPTVTELPRLTDLTLQSGGGPVISSDPISGAISGGGDASSNTFAF